MTELAILFSQEENNVTDDPAKVGHKTKMIQQRIGSNIRSFIYGITISQCLRDLVEDNCLAFNSPGLLFYVFLGLVFLLYLENTKPHIEKN